MNDVDSYISRFDDKTRQRLQAIRSLVFKLAPQAEEKMSYGMPAYKHNGKIILYFSVAKKHIGIYPGRIESYDFNEKLKPYVSGKSTLQFKHNEPLPLELIEQFAKYRLKQLN